MNLWLLAAGLAALALDLVHVVQGGREVHRPMVASSWPEADKVIWSVVWHGATVMMGLGGLVLIAAAVLPVEARLLAAFPVALFLSFGALFVLYGLARLGSLRGLPQWAAFLAVGLLGLIGLAA